MGIVEIVRIYPEAIQALETSTQRHGLDTKETEFLRNAFIRSRQIAEAIALHFGVLGSYPNPEARQVAVRRGRQYVRENRQGLRMLILDGINDLERGALVECAYCELAPIWQGILKAHHPSMVVPTGSSSL